MPTPAILIRREDCDLLHMLGAQLTFTLDLTRLEQSPSLGWSPLSTPAPVHLHLSDALQLWPRCGRCDAADETRCVTDAEALVPGIGRAAHDRGQVHLYLSSHHTRR